MWVQTHKKDQPYTAVSVSFHFDVFFTFFFHMLVETDPEELGALQSANN